MTLRRIERHAAADAADESAADDSELTPSL